MENGKIPQKTKVVFINRNETRAKEVFWQYVPADFEVCWVEDGQMSEEELITQMRDTRFLILLGAGISERALREAKQLKLIQLCTQGADRVPMRVTAELGIPVANAGGANAIAVAEYSVLLMLALLRRIFQTTALLKQGKFTRDIDRKSHYRLYGKCVGIVGFGTVGRKVAKRVRSFDAEVIFYDRAVGPEAPEVRRLKAAPVSLEELLRRADIVTLHVPLLESTRGMMGKPQLSLMKPSAILINTSRGAVVDEAALIEALREKKIAGAGLDVFTQEPPERDNPLLSMENVVATPHIAGYAWDEFVTRFEGVWDNIIRVAQGKPPKNVVHP